MDVVLILCGTVPIAGKKAANEYGEGLERYVNGCSVDFMWYCTYS